MSSNRATARASNGNVIPTSSLLIGGDATLHGADGVCASDWRGALDGKVAVVTGSTSGSGRAIVRRFVEEGAHVVPLARGPERLAEVAAELGDCAVPS